MKHNLFILAVFSTGLFFACNQHHQMPAADTTGTTSPPQVQSDTTPFVMILTHGCRGYCPMYTLTFCNNGKVRYHGIRNMARMGEATFELSKGELQALKQRVTTVNLWQYPERIESRVADARSATLTVYEGTKNHSVYGSIDRPEPLLALEKAMNELAEAHNFPVKDGINPNEMPNEKRQQLLVKLKPEINAGNWIMQFEEMKLRLVRRTGDENIWVISYNANEVGEKALIDMLKATDGVLEAQPNRKTEERH